MREGEPKNESNGQKYLKHTGDESLPVKIISKEKIGEGGYGDVFSTEIERKLPKKNKQFAVKNFRHEEDAQRAIEKFKTLKKNGLKTFITYRLSKDKKNILMTNGNKDGTFLVSFNNSESKDRLETNPIKDIDNFEQLITDMVKHAKKATDKKIGLPFDAYFFSVANTDKPGIKNIDFIIGDLDTIYYKEDILELNLADVNEVLCNFVNDYVHQDNKQKYLDILAAKFKKFEDEGLLETN